MAVPSFAFLLFSGILAIALAISAQPRWRRGLFFVANVTFFLTFSHDPMTIAPFAAFLIVGYLAVKFLERWKRRLPFALVVVAFVAVFADLKQYAFVPHAFLLPALYTTVGISYAFFRILHLMIDTYQGTIEDPVPPVGYFNYVMNFTSLVAGPIQFYEEFKRSEVLEPARLDVAIAGTSFERLALGFAKVTLFAPVFSNVQEWALTLTKTSGSDMARIAAAAIAILVYPMYLFLNFSGYTDFVIAVARFLRLELPENFNAPFVARGFINFWARWHMTLSNWLKTYVYSPLFIMLSRRYPSRRAEPWLGVFAFFVTFFLVGLWHGSTNMFVVYGLLQGLGVSANKAFQILMTNRLGKKRYRALCDHPALLAVSRGLTYEYFAVTLLWFAFSAADLSALGSRLGVTDSVLCLVISTAVATAAISLFASCTESLRMIAGRFVGSAISRVARIGLSTAFIFAVLSLTIVLNDPTPRIVYKAF